MKKFLVAGLVTAMAVAMASVQVVAAESQAGIKFDAGTLEPGGPDIEGVVKNLNFYFGSQAISSSTKEYDSVNSEQAPYNGLGQKVGYTVTNNTGSATQGWEVTVEISEFKQNDTEVMQGFTLTMTPEDGHPKPSAETSTNGNPAPIAKTITLSAGDDSATTLFAADPGEGRGTWGANWTGMLKVLGGTARAGEAKAVMTWNLQEA